KFALWVVVAQQLLKVRQLRIERLKARRWNRKQLAPVGASSERRKLFLDHRKELTDCGPVRLPREVKSDARLLVEGAHPKTICGDRPDLRHLQVGCHTMTQATERLKGGNRMRSRHHVLALQLLAALGHVRHAEVR